MANEMEFLMENWLGLDLVVMWVMLKDWLMEQLMGNEMVFLMENWMGLNLVAMWVILKECSMG